MRCWHCNAPVNVYEDGWICTNCGQAGPPLSGALPTTWREGMESNFPYTRNFMLMYLTSFLRGFVTGASVFFIDLSLRDPLWARKNKTPIHRPTQQWGTGIGFVSMVAAMMYTLYKLEN